MTILVPLLGDQLSHNLASLRAVTPASAVVLMMEVADEATYVPHHPQKIALFFSAMRHFAEELRQAGWTVDYVTLDDPANTGDFTGEVTRAAARHGATSIVTVKAGEWRVLEAQQAWPGAKLLDDDRFLCSIEQFADWAAPRKRMVMEDFYRIMRRQTGLLMDGDQPVGGQWNYDQENRKSVPKGHRFTPPLRFAPDAITTEVMALVAGRFGNHFGSIDGFSWAVTREQALAALADFITHRLAGFGDYQDAMVTGEDVLNHSLLAPALNLGLLSPLEVCQAAEAAYLAGAAPLNAVEGFIRQILGWREYVRGLYWFAGPDYTARNHLAATRPLPALFWGAPTDLKCLSQAVDATRRNAMAHHIQRLMILGNFAMLVGTDPAEVHRWYLAVYADALEWVEAPNVIGMSQFADGGLMATKPYAAGGAYVNRMSNHCKTCRYDVKQRTGPTACPLNSLYWDFLARHEGLLSSNQRLWRMYDGWRRFAPDEQVRIREQAAGFLAGLA
ncbi:cryptochrome/photolyase family protein [Sandarakinorhabdus sp.]|jgi:deoxyribodipyrimidine photolyase-related protein|uniref:cryptochrome/photolyase family protein n=1 Tax=Sandarakinorhabdus sp. TaxID=1916663 RepID=UPI0028A77CDF|nr:cryptochrome/photolyase family protein [Sandarakinorhabdus sp.]